MIETEDVVEQITASRNSIEALRDQDNFPAHLLGATDDLLEAADALLALATPIERLREENARVVRLVGEIGRIACQDTPVDAVARIRGEIAAAMHPDRAALNQQ